MYVEINFIVVQSSFLNSHLVEVDAGVDSRFGLVALQVGFHRLLAHAHGGKHLSNLLQTRRQREIFNKPDVTLRTTELPQEERQASPAAACGSPAARLSASPGPRSSPACSNIPPSAPGYDPGGNTALR